MLDVYPLDTGPDFISHEQFYEMPRQARKLYLAALRLWKTDAWVDCQLDIIVFQHLKQKWYDLPKGKQNAAYTEDWNYEILEHMMRMAKKETYPYYRKLIIKEINLFILS
jgi:hypothetical protein